MKFATSAVILFALIIQNIPVSFGVDNENDETLDGFRLIVPQRRLNINGANVDENLKAVNRVGTKQGLVGSNVFGEGLNADPLSRILQGYENIGRNIVEGIHLGENIGKEIVEGVRRGTEIGIDAGAEFAEALGRAASAFITGTREFSNAVTVAVQDFFNESASNFITVIDSLRQTISVIVNSIQNGIQRQILLEVEEHLNLAAAAAQDAQTAVNNVRDELRNNIEIGASQVLSDWNDWADYKLDQAFQALNGSRRSYKQVENLISDFINTYSGYLNQCAEEIIGDFQIYERRSHDAIERYRDIVKRLITEVQTCLRSSSLVCQRNISNELRKLRNAPRELAALNNEGYSLLNTTFLDNECASQTLVEYEHERPEISYQIQIIISNSEISTT